MLYLTSIDLGFSILFLEALDNFHLGLTVVVVFVGNSAEVQWGLLFIGHQGFNVVFEINNRILHIPSS
jgi:hypothetical protein